MLINTGPVTGQCGDSEALAPNGVFYQPPPSRTRHVWWRGGYKRQERRMTLRRQHLQTQQGWGTDYDSMDKSCKFKTKSQHREVGMQPHPQSRSYACWKRENEFSSRSDTGSISHTQDKPPVPSVFCLIFSCWKSLEGCFEMCYFFL